MNSRSKLLFMMLVFNELSSDGGGMQEFMPILLTSFALLTQNDRNYGARTARLWYRHITTQVQLALYALMYAALERESNDRRWWSFPRSRDWWENIVLREWDDEQWLLNFR